MNKEKVVQHVVDWLLDKASLTNKNGFVIGVSGGIDSAVTSTLCARTRLKTICIEIPIHQEVSQVSKARRHMDFLKSNYENVSSLNVDLTNTFDTLTSRLKLNENSDNDELALANTRSRLRMITLYYFATTSNLLVVGTGNKVEDFGVGFFTKYGDGGVDLSPIADLYKTEVYEIGKEIGILDEILNAKPTDGLWGDNRTDEQQIGASYDELEWAMKIKDNQDLNNISERQKKILNIYNSLHNKNKHKMAPIPICFIPDKIKADLF